MIEVKNVGYRYPKGEAVLDNFSINIEEGGIYGLLGKNGTGKSTLLYVMTGLLRQQSGEVCIDGFNPQERKAELTREMYLVPEEYDMPDAQLSDYVKAMKPFYPRFDEALMNSCLELFDMQPNVNMKRLSMGQKKKVLICFALATNTRYLFMDEPTNGLDILAKSQFRQVLIKGMNDKKTIVISTHQVHDVEHLLDHVIIMERNKVLLQQPLVESEDAPINLEQLFIDTVKTPSPLTPKGGE